MTEHCPTCLRPYKPLSASQRARRGDYPGREREAAEGATEAQYSKSCRQVLDYLRFRWRSEQRGLGDGWVSATHLRFILDGGDGPRRARQLRDEWGWPIEVEMRTNPRQAWYRLTADAPVAEPSTGGGPLTLFAVGS